MEHVQSTRLCNSLPCTAKIELDNVWMFSIYGKTVYSSLPLRYLKAVSGNSINSSQNLVLAQILLWHR